MPSFRENEQFLSFFFFEWFFYNEVYFLISYPSKCEFVCIQIGIEIVLFVTKKAFEVRQKSLSTVNIRRTNIYRHFL